MINQLRISKQSPQQNTPNNPIQSPTGSASLLKSYGYFIPISWLCIMFAVLGFAGFLIPQNLIPWESYNSLFISHLEYTLRLFISLVPLILMMYLNTLWVNRFFPSKPVSLSRLMTGCILILGLAIPILLFLTNLQQLLLLFVNNSFLPYVFYYGFIFFSFYPILFIYMMMVTSLSAKNPKNFSKTFLTKPEFWALFTLVYFLLIIGIVLLGEAFLTELWQYIPYEEYLQRWAVSIMISAIPVALVIPALPLLFIYFGNQTHLVASEKWG